MPSQQAKEVESTPVTIRAANQPRFDTLPPLGLYVHVPWCIQKCPYCDFNSHAIGEQKPPESAYIEALIADLEQDLPLIWGRPIQTLFIGGGTPSLLSGEGIDNLLSQLRARLPFAPELEITLEANPGTVDCGRFRALREAGVNRLSIGIQSFHDDSLRRLGRIHTAQQARQAVTLAREAGFERINLDLMFGLPGQSAAMAERDLRCALALQPTHISYYQLSIEPNTRFHHQPPARLEEDGLWEIQERAKHLLADHGYEQYEISAYARRGHRCRHNLNYWRFGDYLGIGAGAHSKLTLPHSHSVVRLAKVRHPQRYLATAAIPERIQQKNHLQPHEIALEFMMNALRLTDGFETALFAERTGLPLGFVRKPLELAERKGLIVRDTLHIRPTELGRRYLNNLLELFC